MSQVYPAIPSFSHAPDSLGSAVLSALARPIGAKQSWSITRMLVLSLLTFGVAPVLVLAKRFSQMVIGEQQQLLHLARWLRHATGHPRAAALEAEAARIRPQRWAMLLSALFVLGTIAGMYAIIDDSGRPAGHALVSCTYGFERAWIGDYVVRFFPDAQNVFAIWVLGLSAAYAIHWLAIQVHAQEVRQFVGRFNDIARDEQTPPARADLLGVPLRPLWIAGSLCMVLAHAPWGVVAMLAGAAQRRYITHTSRDTRAELAQRLRSIMQRRQPQIIVPEPVYLRQRCIEPRCRAELPRGVNYCRRCGTRQAVPINPPA